MCSTVCFLSVHFWSQTCSCKPLCEIECGACTHSRVFWVIHHRAFYPSLGWTCVGSQGEVLSIPADVQVGRIEESVCWKCGNVCNSQGPAGPPSRARTGLPQLLILTYLDPTLLRLQRRVLSCPGGSAIGTTQKVPAKEFKRIFSNDGSSPSFCRGMLGWASRAGAWIGNEQSSALGCWCDADATVARSIFACPL